MTRVIRAAQATKVISRKVLDARDQAERIVHEAELGKNAIARAAIEDAHARVAATLLEAARKRDAVLRDAQTELEQAAIAATEKLLRTALELRPDLVRAIIADVLDRVRSAKAVTVRVHPSDEADALATAEGAVRAIRIVTDETLTRGGCVVSSELGTIDATVETRLVRLREALQGVPPATESK